MNLSLTFMLYYSSYNAFSFTDIHSRYAIETVGESLLSYQRHSGLPDIQALAYACHSGFGLCLTFWLWLMPDILALAYAFHSGLTDIQALAYA